MSRPKELNFFVEELNWPLGERLVRRPLSTPPSPCGARARRTTPTARASTASPSGSRRPLPDARLIYMVRDPIDRMLSHYLHNVGGGYDDRPLEEALADPDTAYVDRGRYFFQLEPYLERFDRDRIELVTREELKDDRAATMRRVFGFARRGRGLHLGRSSSASGRPAPPSPAAASGSWTAPCACPACARSTATSTAFPSACAGASSASSTTPARERRRSPTLPAELRATLAERFTARRRAARGVVGPQLRLVDLGWRHVAGQRRAGAHGDEPPQRRGRRGGRSPTSTPTSSSRRRRRSRSSPRPTAGTTACAATSTSGTTPPTGCA